jgi:hypothetical protein
VAFEEMLHIMAHTPHRLPAHKPRYDLNLMQEVRDALDAGG